MTTSMALRPSVRAALGALIDYAGLFPPAELPPAQAFSEYRAAREGPFAWMLGRFIVPGPLLADAATVIEGPFSVIVEPNVDALETVANARRQGARVEALEIPLAKAVSPSREYLSSDEILDVIGALEADLSVQGLRALPAFFEVPRSAPWQRMLGETLAAIARFELNAKIRCGGATATAFPTVAELAAFIGMAAASSLPFKATAGLHHPVRHRDPVTGFTMHGFLNILAGAALACEVDSKTLESIVAEEDPSAFRFDNQAFWWRNRSVDVGALRRARTSVFVAYGSCSFREPVEDLGALGMLPER